MGLYYALDGITNLKYKLLYFLTTNKTNFKEKGTSFKRDRCCHLALCLWLILFHCGDSGNKAGMFVLRRLLYLSNSLLRKNAVAYLH